MIASNKNAHLKDIEVMRSLLDLSPLCFVASYFFMLLEENKSDQG